jgi:hypothetical protein
MMTESVPETSEKLFGTTKPPAHPEDGDRVHSRNVVKTSHSGAGAARENLIEFCCCENFKSYNNYNCTQTKLQVSLNFLLSILLSLTIKQLCL